VHEFQPLFDEGLYREHKVEFEERRGKGEVRIERFKRERKKIPKPQDAEP
jgi:hypothetical protein